MESINTLTKKKTISSRKQKKNTIKECWGEFKEILSQAISTNIPTKMLTTRWNVPWITREIKTLIRKKQRVYNKAKRTNNEEHWEEFKLIRRTIKSKLGEHQNFISKILEIEIENIGSWKKVLAIYKIKEKRLGWNSNADLEWKNYGRQ